MNNESLLDAIGNIDDDLIEEARSPKRDWNWKQWTAIAAAFAILIGSILISKIGISPIISTETSPTEGLPLLPALSASGFEQGFVGDPSSVESPSNSNAEMRFPFNAVTAKAIETLPDTYSYVGNREHKFHLVRMELIRPIVGEFEPNYFYYLLPEAYMTDLTRYDSLVIYLVRQFSHAGDLLYNETIQQLEITDHAIMGYYVYLSGSVITAFNNGQFDKSLWYSTDTWASEVGNTHSEPTALALEDYEQYIKDRYSDIMAEPYYERIEAENREAAAALQYIEPFRNGIFIPTVDTLATHNAFYRRYANGYPTNETVYITPDSASYSKFQFTADELADLPDLASGLNTINAAYDAGQITPPNLKGWADMRFVRYVIFGWYEKTANGIYAIIRVSWCYADDTEMDYDKKIHYDDQYYIVRTGTNSCGMISHDELTALINPQSIYILGKYGYDEGGRILPPYRVYY